MAGDDLDLPHRNKLRSVFEEGGAAKVVAFIQGTADTAVPL